METELAYCPVCNRQVHIAWTPMPLHGGQAPLPDGHELICLDLAGLCRQKVCPLSNLACAVMEDRLARAGILAGE